MKKTILYFLFLSVVYACSEGNKNENAIQNIDIDSLLVMYPDSVPLLVQKADTLFKTYQYDEAINFAAKAFRLDSNNVQARLMYAETLNNRVTRSVQDVMIAQRHYQEVLKKDPKNTRALVGLASTYFQQRDFEKAFKYTNEALRINSKYRDAYVLKGTMFLLLNNKEKAISSYETAVQQDPNFYEGYFRLGQIYQSMDSAVCVDYFINALELQPDNSEFRYQVAYSKQLYGDIEGAKETYREMVAKDTIDAYVIRGYFHQGYIKQFMEKEIDSAMIFYKKALEVDPRFVPAWFNIGICHEEKGNVGKALKAYSNCLKYDPEFEKARKRANALRDKQ